MSKKSGGSAVRTKRLGVGELAGSRLMPYLTAPLICIGTMLVALIAHWQWGQDKVMIAVMSIGAVLLTAATWSLWKRRHEHSRNAATIFAGAVLGWLVFATASSPVSPVMLKSWIMGGLFVSAVWGIRHAAFSPHHEDDKAAGENDSLLAKISSLKGARVKSTDETPGRVAAKIQMPKGQAVAGDVQMDKARIASAVAMGEDEITITGVPGRADQVTLAFQLTEKLKKSVRWKGPSAAGQSIAAAPLVPGERADGSDLGMWIVGSGDPDNPRPLPHTLTTGVTGAGKTETIVTAIIDMRWRIDVVPIVADPEKFKQGFGAIEHALGMAIDGEEDTNQFIRNLPDAIKYRAHILGGLTRGDGTVGYQQWEPECWTLHGIPLLFIDIEEAATVLSGNDEFDQAIRTARSVGISLCASMTSAHHSNVERKTRGQFTNSLCHGAVENYDARFALSAGTLEKGADPTKWRNNFPGALYGELVGTNQDSWAVEARAYYLSREQKQAELAASQAAGCWATIDPGTMAYLARGLAAYQAPAAAPVGEDMEETQVNDLVNPFENDEEVDITVPIARPRHDVVFALKPPEKERRLSTEEARDLLESKIDALEAEGKTEITYTDLSDFPGPPEGRTRTWIIGELGRLVEAGRLTQNDGPKTPYFIRSRVLNGQR